MFGSRLWILVIKLFIIYLGFKGFIEFIRLFILDLNLQRALECDEQTVTSCVCDEMKE